MHTDEIDKIVEALDRFGQYEQRFFRPMGCVAQRRQRQLELCGGIRNRYKSSRPVNAVQRVRGANHRLRRRRRDVELERGVIAL